MKISFMENKVLKKLNFKDQKMACVLKAPEAFSEHLADLKSLTSVQEAVKPQNTYDFALLFAVMKTDISALFNQVKNNLSKDGLLWIAYPKKSSKKYKSDISRDDGWQVLGDAGYEGVRMVAIDEDWSALRLRQAEFIKTMKRSQKMAMSEKGKERVKGKEE